MASAADCMALIQKGGRVGQGTWGVLYRNYPIAEKEPKYSPVINGEFVTVLGETIG